MYEQYDDDDDQYLFRLASTFGWDEVIAQCASLAREIQEAASSSSRLRRRRYRRKERPLEKNDDSRRDHYFYTNASSGDEDEAQHHHHDEDDDDDDDNEDTHNHEHYFNDSLCLFNENNKHHYNNNNNGSNTTVVDGDGGSTTTILGRSKQNLIHALRRAHSQLYYADQWGNTPLHAASYVQPPLRVIEGLFQVGRLLWKYHYHDDIHHHNNKNAKGGGKTTPIWAQLCKDGSTPFLVACSTGASPSVLHCYLDEIEYYVEQRWVPSNSNYSKFAVLLPDNQGNSPIMGYMSFHRNWIARNSSEFQRPVRIHGNYASSSQPLGEYWNIARRMLHFATPTPPSSSSAMEEEEDNNSTIALVRCCASIACYCPASLLEWVVSLPPRHLTIDDDDDDDYDRGWFPGHVCAATKDEDGKLPLHLALECRGDVVAVAAESSSSPPCTNNLDGCAASTTGLRYDNVHPRLERNRLQIVQTLLRWYPPAASAVLPDDGRSPLVHAIAHGGSWHGGGGSIGSGAIIPATKGSSTKKNANDDDEATLGLLQLLWRYSPERALEIDPVSGLFPFMLAATTIIAYDVVPDEGPSSSSRPERLGRELIVLDNVYNLLRQGPQVILSLGRSSVHADLQG